MSQTCGAARKVCRLWFMSWSVKPMAMVETAMPMRKAKRCNFGVEPTRKPVFKSCEVSPASAEAMQTTPPMVMASAPKAGAVQPLTRKMAEVAMSVAMVMPEMGLAELPISPTMRELTVTKRNPRPGWPPNPQKLRAPA